jgi:hypothetical protein
MALIAIFTMGFVALLSVFLVDKHEQRSLWRKDAPCCDGAATRQPRPPSSAMNSRRSFDHRFPHGDRRGRRPGCKPRTSGRDDDGDLSANHFQPFEIMLMGAICYRQIRQGLGTG